MTTTPWLTLDDVARILGEERAARQGKPLSEARPLSRETVRLYTHRYTEDDTYRRAALRNPDSDPNAGTYRPVPIPLKPNEKVLLWPLTAEAEWREWYRAGRPGRGAGGGKTKATTTTCPCGCRETVAVGQVCEAEQIRRGDRRTTRGTRKGSKR